MAYATGPCRKCGADNWLTTRKVTRTLKDGTVRTYRSRACRSCSAARRRKARAAQVADRAA